MRTTGLVRAVLVGTVLAPWLTACVGTTRVHRAGASAIEGVPGVPFYVKRPFCSVATIEENRWLEVSVEIRDLAKPSDKPLNELGPVRLGLGSTKLADLVTVVRTVNEKKPADARTQVENAFGALDRQDPKSPDWVVVSKTTSIVPDVDYSTTYYYNGRMPWFGSSTAEANLAPDGTLTKGTTTTDSKADALLTAFIPGKEYLTQQWIHTKPVAPAPVPTTEQVAAIKTLSKLDKDWVSLFMAPAPNPPTGLFFVVVRDAKGERRKTTKKWLQGSGDAGCATAGAGWESTSTEPIEAAPPKPTEEKKAVSFSGTVVLPEEKPKD